MKSWLISGVSQGLGYMMTEILLARGDRVVGIARNIQSLSGLKEAHGDRLRAIPLDITNTPMLRSLISDSFEAFGSIDVLVSNAGYCLVGAAEEIEDDQIESLLDTNLLGSIQFIRAALPFFRRQGGGRIIQVSSENGQMAYPGISIYVASKWGIEGFCDSLATEVSQLNISVTLVEPGATKTSLQARTEKQRQIIDDYQNTTVGVFRRLHSIGKFPMPNDAMKVARAIVAAGDSDKPPRRLVLGGDAYRNVTRALRERLETIEAQRQSAAEVTL